MNHEPVLQKSARLPERRPPCVVPVLIEVPTIEVVRDTSWRPSAAVGFRPPSRRRLRREFRAVGYTLMTALFLSAVIPWGVTPAVTPPSNLLSTRIGLSRTDESVPDAPPLVLISIEPVALAPVMDARFPVFLPGYLLPDDGPDVETAHAGY